MTTRDQDPAQHIDEELRNFREIARHLKISPGEIPGLPGIEVGALELPLEDIVGGDHIIYVDFNRRYDLDRRIAEAKEDGKDAVAENLDRLRNRLGILVADVSGHHMTDSLMGAMLHQAFLLGAQYELDMFGEITTKLFEQLNTRFFRTTSVNKYFTMIYGEINTSGNFRFLSSGHQPPAIFSREYGRFVKISEDRLISFPPVGMLPSSADPDDLVHPSIYSYKKRYEVNEINLLAQGDVMLLHTDGFSDHDGGKFFPARVESLLRESDGLTAGQVCQRLREEICASRSQEDDISVVAIRRAE